MLNAVLSTGSPGNPEIVIRMLGPESKESPGWSGNDRPSDREGAAGTHPPRRAPLPRLWTSPDGPDYLAALALGPASHHLHCVLPMS